MIILLTHIFQKMLPMLLDITVFTAMTINTEIKVKMTSPYKLLRHHALS